MRQQLALPDRWRAARDIHFPPPDTDLRLLNAFRSPAHLRLIFEEFFWLELGLTLKKDEARARVGIAFQLNERVREKIKAMLPFKPTAAQKRVLGEIARDMAAPRPMSRLLQGDVGSGKTIVAAEAAVIAVENGYQAALLAPTEILATQHYLYLKPLLNKLGYVAGLFTGSSPARENAVEKLLTEGLIHGPGTHVAGEGCRIPQPGPGDCGRAARFGVIGFGLLARIRMCW
jgi:ATP-dependent DNA helicase RecG